MSQIKFGVSQTDKPAPAGYRNFSNAMIIFIIPGIVVLVSGWGFTPVVLNHWLLALSFAPALIKGIGTFLGNGQYYTSDPKAPDNPHPADAPKQ